MPFQIQAKRTTRLILRTFIEESKLKIGDLWYCLTVLHPRDQENEQYGQIVWSLFPYPIMSRGGGLPQKGEGGEFSGPNDKPTVNRT